MKRIFGGLLVSGLSILGLHLILFIVSSGYVNLITALIATFHLF
ncbi:MAG: hypothetical protein ABI700_25265 [Chloroflexota bacterium]